VFSTTSPLVSVVIPVYNGEEFIADAVRSVLGQTYTHFDLTIVNNRSTDRTLAIAEQFAVQDDRVRVRSNRDFLSVVDNHNMALSAISDDAKYAKILDADDWFFPDCIAELVRVAEAYPTVGMVTSYVLSGTRIGWDGLPYPSTFLTGREVCRLRLLHGLKVFGGPSASLLRASIVREMRPFYNPLNYHGDNEAYLRLLEHHDFGFVHQVLSYNRRGEASRTTAYLDRVSSYPAADVDEVTKFGPTYLSERECADRLRDVTREYYRFLAQSALEFRGREFWHYHLRHFRAMGYSVDYPRLGLHVLNRIADLLLNPKRTIEGAFRRLASRRPGVPRGPAPLPVKPAAG
jgi:glycosyltransferase involved in cell wall biosynthesis